MSKAKTRQDMANELGMCTKTFRRWIKKKGIELPSGLLSEYQQKRIRDVFTGE